MEETAIKTGDIVSGGVLAGLGVFIILEAKGWDYLGPDGPGPGFFPLWYGIALVALSLLLVVMGFRAGGPAGPALSNRVEFIDEENRRFAGTKTDRDAFSSGLRGVLPTGLSYNLGGDPSRRTGTDPSGNFATASGDAPITLRQPLVKNFWIDSTRLDIRLSKNRVKTSELLLRLSVMETIHAVELTYYNLILPRENVKVQDCLPCLSPN